MNKTLAYIEQLIYTCSKNNIPVPEGILVSKKDYNDVMLFKHRALQYDVNNENGPIMQYMGVIIGSL